MIKIYIKTEKDAELNQIQDYRQGSFIYVKQANLDDLDQVDHLLLHEIGDIHGSIDKYEVPRVEQHGKNILLFTRHPGNQEIGLHTEPLTLIMNPNYLIAISPYENPIIDHILTLAPPDTTTQKSQFLLYLLTRISHQFTTSIKQVRHSILLHERPSRMINSQAIIDLTKNEEVLNQYLTALLSMRNLLEALTTHHYFDLTEQEKDELKDILISISQSEDLCRVNVKSIHSLRDSYQIIFTNDVNKTIKRLTAITILLSIPTVITSIFGMNIPLPFQHTDHAFSIVMGGAALICIFAAITFYKNRWL